MSGEILCFRTFAEIIREKMSKNLFIKKIKKDNQSEADFLHWDDREINEKNGSKVECFYRLLYNSITYKNENIELPAFNSSTATQLKKGDIDVPEKVVKIAQLKSAVEEVAYYFSCNLIPNIPEIALLGVLSSIDGLVQGDKNLGKARCNELKNDFTDALENNKPEEYLAKVFIIAIGNENKIKKDTTNNDTVNDVKTKLRKAMEKEADKFIQKHEIADTLLPKNLLLNLLRDDNPPIYLYGEGGIGKTFSLMDFVRNMVSSKDKKDRHVVPVFIKLSDYQIYYTNNGNRIDGLFIIKYAAKLINPTECTYSTLENSSVNSILTEFKKPKSNNAPEYILLLDGLNEVASELKYGLAEEIDKFLAKDSEYSNTRIVLTGRNKNNYDGKFDSSLKERELPPITESTIKTYLRERGYENDVIRNITANQRLLECIKIPFYLNKFIKIEGDTGASASKFAILRAYYAEQPGKFHGYKKQDNIEFILNSIVPEIANHMEKNDMHKISKEDICGFLNPHDESTILPIFENELCIISSDSPEHYKFDHDNIRDYFAAVYTVNIMRTVVDCYQNNESIFEYIQELNGYPHSSWGKERIYFINECLETEKFNLDSIMDIYRDNPKKIIFEDGNYEHIEIRNQGIKNIVNCIKLSKDTKEKNFSSLDLRNISLTGFDWESSNFTDSKISQKTLIPQGHISKAKNIAVADKTGECFTISKDDFILRYNINNQDVDRIFIKNFDETGNHITCSAYGDICFISDSNDNVWVVYTRDKKYPMTMIISSKKLLKQYKNNYSLIDIVSSDDGMNFYALYNNDENGSLILYTQKDDNDNYGLKQSTNLIDKKINCFCLFANKLYLGAETGELYRYENDLLSEEIPSCEVSIRCVCAGNEDIFIGLEDIKIIKYNVDRKTVSEYIKPEEIGTENLVLKKIFCSKDGKNFGGYFYEARYFIMYDENSRAIKKIIDKDIKIACIGYYNTETDKSRYVICCSDHNIYIKTLDHNTVHILEGRSGFPRAFQYMEESNSLICAFWDRSIKKFDFKEGGKLVENKINVHDSFIDTLAYISVENFFITGSCDKHIKLWGENFIEIPNAFSNISHKNEINTIVCSIDGKFVYSAGMSEPSRTNKSNTAVGTGEFFIWTKSESGDNIYSGETPKFSNDIPDGKIGIINSLACNETGGICFVGSADFHIYKYNRDENLLSVLYKGDGYIDETACSSDGLICYSVLFLPEKDGEGNKGHLIKWDSESGEHIIFKYESENDGIKYVTCNDSGDICYIGTGDGKIYLCTWDKDNKKHNITAEDNAVIIENGISCLKCSSDGKKLFAGCDNKIIKYDLNEDYNLKESGEWDIIENINIIGCEFSESAIEDEKLIKIIETNGGLIY